MLIDTHCHLEDVSVLERARLAGVKKIINIGCDILSSQKARDFGVLHEDVFFSAGVHPHEASKVLPDYVDQLKKLAADPKCVGIGECGFDYYYKHSDQDSQKKVFKAQIALSHELNKTLIVHVRDAYEDCLSLLTPTQSIVIHCFSGNKEHAKAFLDLGCYLSMSGIITFKNAQELRKVVYETPLEKLLIETDAPYLAPMPYRGKPNEPAYVSWVAKKIAEIKAIPIQQVIDQTGQNALDAFKGLSNHPYN